MAATAKRGRNSSAAVAAEGETPDRATLHQDSYRKVLFGQAADPIFPPHPLPPEVPEEELLRQATADTSARWRDARHRAPPFGRWLLLAALAALALGFVLVRHP